MNPATFAGINYSQQLNTCVLASYAVACFPFTGTPVLDYFVAYCRHFNLDQAHPERSYETHFLPLSRTTPGYRVLGDLHNGCGEQPFIRARDAVTLGSPVGWPNDTAAAEAAIRQPDCVLLMFLNVSAVQNLMGMHSIVVGHNGCELYYLDTGRRPLDLCQVGPRVITGFGGLGDAYLVARQP